MSVRVSRTVAVDIYQRSYRVAGWAAIVAALAFLVQPLSVGFLPFDLEEMRDPVELSRYWWAGTLQAAEFTVIAVSILVCVAALQPVWVESAWGRATWILGLASGLAFLLQAALSAATYSWWLMQDAASFTPDSEARSAILFGTFVVGYTFLGLANLASAGWIMGLAASGRRSGLIGAAFAGFMLVAAAILTVGTLTGFTIPTVVIHLPLWLALGVKLLRARPASEVATGR
jgi:hypothetical protein